MKQLVKNYTLSVSGKTVTLGDFTTNGVVLERLSLIVDTTQNIILYNFADPTVSTATVATDVITLSTMGAAVVTDKLMIIYDCQIGDPVYDAIGSAIPGYNGQKTGTITTSSSAIQTGAGTGYGGYIEVSIYGTYAGISFGITESDNSGTTLYNVPIYDAQKNAWLAPGATISPVNNSVSVYWIPSFNSNEVKVLASAYTSGTGNITINRTSNGFPGSTMAQLMDAAGNNRGANVSPGGSLATQHEQLNSAVAVSASLTVVKNSAGHLSGALVTTAGTSQALTIYDNASAASGTVIGIVPSGATLGSYWPFNMPATNGITCSGSSSNPAVTIAYS